MQLITRNSDGSSVWYVLIVKRERLHRGISGDSVPMPGAQAERRFLPSNSSNELKDTYPLPAGKDQKLSREFEGGTLIGSEATVPSPLEWDTYPQTAGKDQKPSWGFGGEAPDLRAVGASGIVAAGGAALSSLDSITNNRNNRELLAFEKRPQGRGKYCGRMSVTGVAPKTGRKVYRRVNCGSWTCSYCGPRKANSTRWRVREVAEALGLRYFLTLTLDPNSPWCKSWSVEHLVFGIHRDSL